MGLIENETFIHIVDTFLFTQGLNGGKSFDCSAFLKNDEFYFRTEEDMKGLLLFEAKKAIQLGSSALALWEMVLIFYLLGTLVTLKERFNYLSVLQCVGSH